MRLAVVGVLFLRVRVTFSVILDWASSRVRLAYLSYFVLSFMGTSCYRFQHHQGPLQ